MTSSIESNPCASIIESLLRTRQDRKSFAESELFHKMLSALRDAKQPLCADSEELKYFPERRVELGWGFADVSHVNLFFDVVGDPAADSAEPLPPEKGSSSPFQSCAFRHYGLNVWMLFGQGTAVLVSNDAAIEAKNKCGTAP